MVTIELSDEDAVKFQMFCKYWDKISVLQASGALDIVSGKAVVHYDHKGSVARVDADAVIYMRKKEYIVDKTVVI